MIQTDTIKKKNKEGSNVVLKVNLKQVEGFGINCTYSSSI